MPTIPHTVRIKAEVTEPTMTNNVWTLAQFVWDGRVGVARQDIEEHRDLLEWTVFCAQSYNELRVQFDMWLDPLPAVTRWDRHFEIEEEMIFETDVIAMRARASGWFELSDDLDRMEKLLAQVSCERLNMQPIYFRFPDDPPPPDRTALDVQTIEAARRLIDPQYWRGPLLERDPLSDALDRAAGRSLALDRAAGRALLERGTADNNINPSYDIRRFHLPDPLDDRERHPGLVEMPGSQSVLRDMLDASQPVREVYRNAIVYGQAVHRFTFSEPLDSSWSADHNPAASTTAEETPMSDPNPTQPPEAATTGQTQGGGEGQPPETYGSEPAQQPPEHSVATPPTPAPDLDANPNTAPDPTPTPEPSAEPPEGTPV
jgi:hypothetical protein